MTNENDIELVIRACNRDAHAFALLYERIYQKMYSYAVYILKNENDAQDVISETVTDAFVGISGLNSPEAFNNWIFRILHNKCNRKIREYYMQRETENVNEQTFVSQTEIDISANLDLRQAFDNLDDVERTIIGMHVILGYKTREIAEILELNENTVRTKESRALKKMRKWLG